MTLIIRAVDRAKDRREVEAIDTTFETDTVFDLVTTARRIELIERRLERPLVKRYSIDEVFAGWTAPTACSTAATCRARPPSTWPRACDNFAATTGASPTAR